MNTSLTKTILHMSRVDQEARHLVKPKRRDLNILVYSSDAANGFRIRTLIEEYGYPTQRLIGAEAMHALWLLVQHQDLDIKLQKQCLKRCDFDKKDKAFLTDRIRVNNGKKQIYGTQFFRNPKGKLVPRPMVDASRVNKRRSRIGLELFEEYARKMRKSG